MTEQLERFNGIEILCMGIAGIIVLIAIFSYIARFMKVRKTYEVVSMGEGNDLILSNAYTVSEVVCSMEGHHMVAVLQSDGAILEIICTKCSLPMDQIRDGKVKRKETGIDGEAYSGEPKPRLAH